MNNTFGKLATFSNEINKTVLNISGCFLVGVLVGISTATLAEDELELYYSYYTDDSGLNVTSPSFFISKDISKDSILGFMYLHETYEKSAQGGTADADVVSGATTVVGGGGSSFEEKRNEIGAYATHQLFKDTKVGIGYYYGDEEDYKSGTLTFSADQELFDKNLTLSGRIMFGHDEVDKQDADATESFPKDKDVERFVFAATQLISPRSFIVGGLALENQEGYLSSPTRRIAIDTSVGAGGVRVVYDERHPDERLRQVYFLRGKQFLLTKSAIDLNLSYYTDDWGVDANSAEFRFSQYISPQFIARLRYRYYQQSEADFYETDYTVAEEIMTADARLREYESRLYGFKFTYFPKRATFNDMSVSFSIDTYEETHGGITADIVQIWLEMPY